MKKNTWIEKFDNIYNIIDSCSVSYKMPLYIDVRKELAESFFNFLQQEIDKALVDQKKEIIKMIISVHKTYNMNDTKVADEIINNLN